MRLLDYYHPQLRGKWTEETMHNDDRFQEAIIDDYKNKINEETANISRNRTLEENNNIMT